MIEIQNGILSGTINESEHHLKGEIASPKVLNGKIANAPGSPTQFHSSLVGRDEPNSHPIEAIANLAAVLDGKMGNADALTNKDIEALITLFV